jgi:hypothetical protein
MRAAIVAFLNGLALAAAAVQAAPLAPLGATPVELGAAPPIELVRDSCGRGWHRTHWRPMGRLALGSLRSELGPLRRLARRVAPSPCRLARSLWGLG